MIYFESQLDLDGKVEHKRSFTFFPRKIRFRLVCLSDVSNFRPTPAYFDVPVRTPTSLVVGRRKIKIEKKWNFVYVLFSWNDLPDSERVKSLWFFFWEVWSIRSDSFGRVSKPMWIYVRKWIMCLERGRICVWMNVGKQMASKPVFQWKQTFSVNIQLD